MKELIKDLVLILGASVVIVLFFAFISTGKEKKVEEKHECKQEHYSPKIVQDTIYYTYPCDIDSQEVAYGYLKSNGVLKDITD